MRYRIVRTLLPALLIATTAAPAGPVHAAHPGLQWAACFEAPNDPAVQCATLRVPVDWSRPHGQTFGLALARREATDPAARIGSLVYGPGGPGGSGVDAVLDGVGFSDEIHRRFDIVSFDPRGVSRSHPVLCSAELLDLIPFPEPRGQSELDEIVAYNGRLRADCRARTGPLFDHVDTLSTVHDLEAIRAALGERRLTFAGGSYGTVLGAQYAERFPHRVRAIVLDSVLDHSLGTRGLLDAGAIALQDSFDQFAAWCERERACVLHGRDVRALVRTIFGRIERGEIIIPGDPPRPARPFDFVITMTEAFRYGSVAWGAIADFLLFLETDVAPALAASAARSPGVPFPGRAIRCADFLLPMRDHADYLALLRRSALFTPDMRYSAERMDQVIRCLGTPAPIPNPQHALRVRHLATPILLVNNRHDPVTGFVMAANAARQLGGNGRLLTHEGWGHGAYGSGSECLDGAVDRYLVSLRLPAPGTTCPAVPVTEGRTGLSLVDNNSYSPLPSRAAAKTPSPDGR